MSYRALFADDITDENENEIKTKLLTTLSYNDIKSTFTLSTFTTVVSDQLFVDFKVNMQYGFNPTEITIDVDVDLADQIDNILEQYFEG